jgi:NitT/TauT family transport system permease protein/sulfonate transport system permease protein
MVSWHLPSPGQKAPLLDRCLAEGGVVVALLIWTLTARSLPSFILPQPWDVARAIGQLLVEPSFAIHTLASAVRVVASVMISLTLGLCLALVARTVPVLEWVVTRRIQPFLNSFPSMGWALLAAIWFNFNNASVIFVQVVILLPFSIGIFLAGLAEIDPEMIEMGRSFTRRRLRVFLRVSLPLLMPYVMAALRTSYGIGWKIALVSEFTGVETGLGYLMLSAQSASNVAMVLATCFVIVGAFIAGEKLLIDPLARRWKPAA